MPEVESRRADEVSRIKIFIATQVFFLFVSAGGFHFRVWSMLDSALLIQSIGVTALVVILDEARARRWAFRAAVALYLLTVRDMGINVVVSGFVGWQRPP